MIDKLNQLTVDQFIDLVCGKVNVILCKHEVQSPEQIAITVRNIIIEYRDIADPGEETDGWMECEHCGNTVQLMKYIKTRRIPCYQMKDCQVLVPLPQK